MGQSQSGEADGEQLAGELQWIDTHVGKLQVRVLGNVKDISAAGATPVICFHGAKSSLIPEWVPIAAALADTKKFVVVIPNFHSNDAAKPTIVWGGMQPPDLCKIVKEAIIGGFLQSQRAVIMGKSWGGHMGYTYAALEPETVIKLVLQAPAWTTADRVAAVGKHQLPLLLCWAKNDNMMSYSNVATWEKNYDEKHLQVYTAERGGHAVTMEYKDPIMNFLLEA